MQIYFCQKKYRQFYIDTTPLELQGRTLTKNLPLIPLPPTLFFQTLDGPDGDVVSTDSSCFENETHRSQGMFALK